MKRFDLLVVGEINPDLILSGQDVTPTFGQVEKLIEKADLTIGSSAVITACGAARLGLKVAFIGLTGADLFGRFMLAVMQGRGIDTSGCVVDPNAQTGLGIIFAAPADRAILTFPGAIPLLRYEQINLEILADSRHLHVGSYFLLDALRPDLPKLFAEARGLGLTTSLDTNWDPRGTWDVPYILTHCDILFPNQAELARISGQMQLADGLKLLTSQVPVVAVKLGAAGGTARRGRETAESPALPVKVVDTVGAGDSFNAGFIYGHLNGLTLQESLRLACACGSLSTRAAGGTTAQPTWQEIRDAQIS